jgi:hypothetical protein
MNVPHGKHKLTRATHESLLFYMGRFK